MDVVGYFLDCIVEGKEPFITLDDGLECVRVMAAIEKSAKEERPVLMSEIE
jgi:predicted dehydrogenase